MAKVGIGDILFSAEGRPGIIIGKSGNAGALVVQRDGPDIKAAKTRSYINGVPPEARAKFNEIMDQMNGMEDPKEKIISLTKQIEELKVDPRNHLMTRYLEGELAYIMNSTGNVSKEYTTSEYELR